MSTINVSKAESSYISEALLSPTPTRADGRGLLDFRTIFVETSVAPLANGSGRAIIGDNGTEVIVAARLEVEERADGGGFECEVTCTAAAYPQLSNQQLDVYSHHLSTILHDSLCESDVIVSPQLTIVPKKRRWLLSLEAVIISDVGNVVDALFIAARAALWDLRIPRTRALEEYKSATGVTDDSVSMQVDSGRVDAMGDIKAKPRTGKQASDFELEDYWDDGLPLNRREELPICVTMNLLPPMHFLDATAQEESSVPCKMHLTFSFARSPPGTIDPPAVLHHTRISGSSEIPYKMLQPLLEASETYCRSLNDTLNAKLKDEDGRRATALSRR